MSTPPPSNFRGKDDLFLAVLDAEARRRFPLHTEAMLGAAPVEEGLRASAREMAGYAREHPGWTAVYVEFWTHASRRPELRRRVAEQHERLLDTVGELLEGWTARWQVEFKLPAREVVRGVYAISRGMGLEALLADEPGSDRHRAVRGTVAVQPFRLRAPFAELLEVRQYQVVHDPAGLHVAVVLREEAPADTPARVRAALALQLHDAGAVPPPIEVTPVAKLRRDPGHGPSSS